jgi:hypothetical protein
MTKRMPAVATQDVAQCYSSTTAVTPVGSSGSPQQEQRRSTFEVQLKQRLLLLPPTGSHRHPPNGACRRPETGAISLKATTPCKPCITGTQMCRRT